MKPHASPIFVGISLVVFFIVNLMAVYLLLRGHNLPGGGFIAGVATAISIILLALAIGLERAHAILRLDPVLVAVTGLLVATLTGTLPIFLGHSFLETYNYKAYGLPVVGQIYLGTPILFDLGVYLVVVGVIVKVVFILAESTGGFLATVQEDNARYSSPLEEPIEEHAVEDPDFHPAPEALEIEPAPGAREEGLLP